MLDILFALVIGILIGILTGLLPGLHPNNTIPLILGLSFLFEPLAAAVVLLSAGIVNSFMNFIPSVFLGAPDDSNVLSLLPGHKLFLEGRGYEAVKLSVIGSLGGILFAVAVLPMLTLTIPTMYSLIRPYVHWILIAVAFLMMLEERKLFSVVVFFLSGFLGYVSLNYSSDLIFPLLTGLFGLPSLLIAYKSKTKFPEEFSLESKKNDLKNIFSSVSIGSLAGILAGLLPAIGSAQSTLLTQRIFRKKDKDGRNFLMSIGSVTISDIMYSILALWLIGNPRSGIAVAIGKLMEIQLSHVLVFVSVALVSAAVATVLTLTFSRNALSILRKINYSNLCLTILMITMSLIVLFSGILGVTVSIVAMVIGLIPNYKNVRRTNCMGCLIIPTILYFL